MTKNRLKMIETPKDTPMEVNWYVEWGVMIPHCPRCDELAYQEDECVFCHQKFIYTDKPQGYEDTIITIGEWTIIQVYGSWGVYIEHNGQEIMHASCSKKLSEKRLKEWLETYAGKKD